MNTPVHVSQKFNHLNSTRVYNYRERRGFFFENIFLSRIFKERHNFAGKNIAKNINVNRFYFGDVR